MISNPIWSQITIFISERFLAMLEMVFISLYNIFITLKDVGESMATILDVAREAEVSPATVSRVINNSFLVSEEKKQRVYEAMQKVGYTVTPKHRSAKSNGKLLVAITNMSNYDLFDGMQRCAAELGYGLVFAHTSDRPGALQETIELLKVLDASGQVAGILLINFILKSEIDFIHYIQKYPVVQVMEAVDLENNYLVSTDDYQAAYDAVSHLIEQGRKRIAIYITKLPENRMNFEKLRLHGYNAALMDHGLQHLDELLRYADFNFEGAEYTTKKMLKTMDELPDAILCMSDTVARGCVKTLLDNGISVPDDIAVVGIDDLEGNDYMTPSLTSVAQAFDIIGEESVRLLSSIINGETTKGRKIYVPHKLVVRQSSNVRDKE